MSAFNLKFKLEGLGKTAPAPWDAFALPFEVAEASGC